MYFFVPTSDVHFFRPIPFYFISLVPSELFFYPVTPETETNILKFNVNRFRTASRVRRFEYVIVVLTIRRRNIKIIVQQ